MLPIRTFLDRPSRYSLFSLLVGESGVAVELDVPYGPAARHRMDVYEPPQGVPVSAAILFLYGGGWRSGCRSCYGFVGAALAAKGIRCYVPDYRLVPEVRWPGFVEDAALATSVVQDRERGLGGNRALLLAGHSAGAHSAAMLALDRRWLGNDRQAALAGLIGLSGPYWFDATTWPTTADIFATASHPDEPRPVAHVGPHAPPALLIHGAADTTVKPRNTIELAKALRDAGRPVEEVHFPGLDHKGPLVALARPFRRRAPVLDLIVAMARRATARESGRQGAGTRGATRNSPVAGTVQLDTEH